MPYVIPCPQCAARLKTAQEVPAGRKITCPQCQTSFTTTEPAALLVDPPAPVSPPTPSPPPAPPRKKSLLDDANMIEEPEVLEPYIEEDDVVEERPPVKRRRDEDERRPVKHQWDDEDDDDRPRAKRRRAAEDDDDDRPAPRKRRSRDDDEDEDDRPRRRRPNRTGSNRKVLLLFGLFGGAVFMVLMAVLAMNLLGVFSVLGGGAPSDMLAYVPSETTNLRYMDFNEIARISDRPGVPRFNNAFGRLGMGDNEILSVLVASNNNGAFGGQRASIFRMKNSIDTAKIVGQLQAREATMMNKKYYRAGNECFHFPSSNVMVVTQDEATMHQLLTRNGQTTMNLTLKDAQSRCRGMVWTASAGPGTEKAAGAIDGVSGRLLAETESYSVSASRVTIRNERVYDSNDYARKLAAQLENTHAQARAQQEKAGVKVEVSRQGSSVILTREAPLEGNLQRAFELGMFLGGL